MSLKLGACAAIKLDGLHQDEKHREPDRKTPDTAFDKGLAQNNIAYFL